MNAPGIYSYETYYFRMFTLLMALLCLIFLVNSEFIGGSISFALGFLLSFSYQGVKIDPEQKRYLKYDRFAWFRIGQWKPMSPPAYVTIVRINLSSHRNLPSPLALPDDRKGAKSYKVNLVVEGDERYISICRGPLEGMTAEALRLGRHLGIRVLDFSTHEKKWIL
jgi:hypothetical protein